MIESPPVVEYDDLIKYIHSNETIDTLVEKINSKYEYWSDVKYKKLPTQINDHNELWCRVKLSRRLKSVRLWHRYGINSSITNYMQKMCHDFDMNFGGSWGTNSIIDDNNREQYLVSSLMEEAISSSQMEGASTTRKIAKDMLRNKIAPKDKSQQMIFNNYNTIRFIVDNRDNALSEELLLKIHALMTDGTLDDSNDAGRFRTDDQVVVENGITHETVHIPPPHSDISQFMDDLCHFFNDDSDDASFIHPIIKGIVIHFMIGYMHPFVDGNGRTARALFYWYMLKKGYWLTQYLSVSKVISKSKRQYEKAYQYSESDGNDIGYFITYNLNVLHQAFKELKLYINRKLEERRDVAVFLKLGDINERQATIIKIFADDPKAVVTVKDIEIKCGVVPATAKRDLVGLLDRGIITEIAFNKVKKGYIRSDNFDKIVM